MARKKVLKSEVAIAASGLPQQDKFFATENLKRSARSGTQLPDPTHAPYGYDAAAQFKHLFPALELPILRPPASHHPEDRVSFGSPELKPHELFLGDNLYLLRQMPSESVDLIYIDPPFFSNRTYTQIWGDDNEVRSFNDIFQDGMFSYLAWLNARLWEMKRVLKSTGSIYVHCDWHASHYIKTEMDKTFGYDNFQNEIVWCYSQGGRPSDRFSNKHDILLNYKKDKEPVFNQKLIKIPYELLSKKSSSAFTKTDENGRKYQENRHGKSEKLYRYYEDEGKVPYDWWTDIHQMTGRAAASGKEYIGYPTQKPETLLERIIKVSSSEGDVVADFFMGGGTTGAVALKNGRRFIGCDISRVAVSVSASRLIEIGEEI